MVRRPRAHETIVGVASIAAFGPVILFGQGGVAVEVIADRAVALPPLNLALARELVSRTRIARLLDGYRDRPPADREALYLALTRVSQLIADLPEVVELDINPLLVDDKGVMALDARMRVALAVNAASRDSRFGPIPRSWRSGSTSAGDEIVLRPIRPRTSRSMRGSSPRSTRRICICGFFTPCAPSRTRSWRGSRRSTTTARWRSSPPRGER